MKILSIDNMLTAAEASELPNVQAHVKALEAVATVLAADLARHLGIDHARATWEGEAMAGLCAVFGPCKTKQRCPHVIHEGDPSGDWDRITRTAKRQGGGPSAGRK